MPLARFSLGLPEPRGARQRSLRPLKLVTWNVNSLNDRLPRVLEFVAEHAPDVLCMQETKCEPAAFPAGDLAAAGYGAVHHSAGRWAGVAIAAREGLELADPVSGLPGELRGDDARWIEATVGGLRVASVYVPNGREVGSPTYEEKLAFLDAMAVRAAVLRAAGEPLAIAGDFNVAPADIDVYDPAAFAGSTHVQPEERSRVQAICAAGDLVDAFRALHPDAVQHTWWDYRQGHFHRGMGLRIDLALVSASLRERLLEAGMERNYRKGSKPSDHAPLVVDLA
jgi:exodeoxyribonuclease-3